MENTSFPRYVRLTTKTVVVGLLGKVMWLFAVLVIPIWRFFGSPLAEWFAMSISSTLTTSIIVGLFLSNRALHRLFSYYNKKLKNKLLAYIFFLICPIPILELKWLCSDRSDSAVKVNAFLKRNSEGRYSLMHSILEFFDNTEIDVNKLAELIRSKSNYFATTRDDEDILIATNRGLVVCSISENAKLYMFVEVDPTKQPFSLYSDCGWELEYSQNMSAAAYVYEQEVDPSSDVESLSETIINAIDSLLNKKEDEKMNNEVVNEVVDLLLERGLVRDAQYDACFSVTFLTTPFLDDAGTPIEVIFDDTGDVISIVGRISCYLNNTLNKTTLLQILLLIINRTNEEIIESEGVGTWFLNENGDFLYAASAVKDSSREALASFCGRAITTFSKTRPSLSSIV